MIRVKYLPSIVTSHLGGEQLIYKFENSPYEVSVVRHKYSYGYEQGLWELAILRDGKLCYGSGITEDVIGHLTEDQVQEYLAKVDALRN